MAKAEYKSAKRSRHLIHSALFDLMGEKPFEKITVTDIVKRADINRGTFYAHYANVPDVLQHLLGIVAGYIRAEIDGAPTSEEIPGRVMRMLQRLLEENMSVARCLMTSSAEGYITDYLGAYGMERLLEDGKVVTAEQRVLLTPFAFFCTGGMIATYRAWFAGQLDITLDELTGKSIEIMTSLITGAFLGASVATAEGI